MSQPFTSTLLEELGRELSIEVLLEPQFRQVGRVQQGEGRYRYFKLSSLDVNPSGSAKIAGDKTYASYFMSELGYPVPEGKAFFSDAWCAVNKTTNDKKAAMAYAQELGFPVIIKPNAKAQGAGVMKVANLASLERGLDQLFLLDNIVVVQRVVVGKDYRLIVYRDTVPIAYERRPLSVIGTGSASLEKLLADRREQLVTQGRALKLESNDERLQSRLREQGLTLASVPKNGEEIQLLQNANMSTGGTAIDVSASLHPSFIALAQRLTQAMGLALCGVDLMTKGDPTAPLGEYTIIEINDHPGLEHYAALSDEARNRVKSLYRTILHDLVHR
ncbi:MAG: hypothetical protein A2542_01915 [Parcubacteria group bacterium RIFOXYD2_FULL_52_8]|nr:MAG: hypothetical protein A2542_01915 [Parcubacteria group bacterium RIFOXYD2_FULL_52_8]